MTAWLFKNDRRYDGQIEASLSQSISPIQHRKIFDTTHLSTQRNCQLLQLPSKNMTSLKSRSTGWISALFGLLLLASSIQAQDLAACPSNITNEETCGAACGGESFDFVVLADATSDDQNVETVTAVYTGFNCECAEAATPVSCTSKYDFPTCAASNVTDCTTGKCADYCFALGFKVWFCGSDPISCECEADALVENGTVPVSTMYVCGDEGWTPRPAAAASFANLVATAALAAISGVAMML